MAYQRRTTPPHLQRLMIVIGVVAVVTLVPPLRGLAQRALGVLVRPITPAWQSVSHQWTVFRSSSSIGRENVDLKRRNEQLTQTLAKLQEQAETSATMKEVADYLVSARRRAVTAAVIGYSPDPGIQSFVINKGSRDGLRKGLAVIDAAGTMVGKVQSVEAGLATILALSDSQSRVVGRIRNEPRSPGIVRGERGLGLQMELIPKNDTVAPNEIIVTSGTETDIPPDVVIGTVKQSVTRSGELFQNATLVWPVQLNQMKIVAVVLP